MTIPLPFRGDPPDRRDAVLRQSIPFNPAQWRLRLPDPSLWPDELSGDVDGQTWPSVDREQVLDIGLRATDPVGATHTYVAAAVWGTGTQARGVVRRCRPFVDMSPSDGDPVGTPLAAAVGLLLDRDGGPVAAYDALHSNGQFRVPYIGPAFGTKVLYFSGFDRVVGRRQPLILDRFVAAALNHLCGFDWPTTDGGWTTEQYAAYLHIAHTWADEWGCRPDVVERVLFSLGRTDPVAVRALAGAPVTMV